MDILRVLATPDLEVKKKTLQLALDLVSSRNVEEVSLVCKHNVEKGEFSQFISSVAMYVHNLDLKYSDTYLYFK